MRICARLDEGRRAKMAHGVRSTNATKWEMHGGENLALVERRGRSQHNGHDAGEIVERAVVY